jgi:uncharacterized membrane protein
MTDKNSSSAETTKTATAATEDFFQQKYRLEWDTPAEMSFSSLLSTGQKVVFDNLGFFLKFALIFFAIIFIPSLIVTLLFGDKGFFAALFQFAVSIWQIIASFGALKMMLALTQGQSVSLSDLYTFDKQQLVRYFVTNIRYMVTIVLGFILLIVPGIIWSIKYQFAPVLAADEKEGDLMKISAEMTQGIKVKLFLYSLGFGIVNMVGMLFFGIGLLITGPITAVAYFTMYRMLRAQQKQA